MCVHYGSNLDIDITIMQFEVGYNVMKKVSTQFLKFEEIKVYSCSIINILILTFNMVFKIDKDRTDDGKSVDAF